MTFSISKKYKIQSYFYTEKLGGGKVLSEFLEGNEDQPKKWTNLVQLEKKIKWTLHDIYSVPKFEDIYDLITFFKDLEWKSKDIDETEFKTKIIRDICLAYKLAIEYLKHEQYHFPDFWHLPESGNDLIKIMHRWEKLTSVQGKMGYCTILKEVLWFFRIIRCKDFSVNYETWKIDLRNKEFIQKIMDIFASKEFIYEKEFQKFSQTSSSMSGELFVDTKQFPIYVWFGVKSLYSMIEKMDGQEKYDLPEAFKDIHRMRIEIEEPANVLRTAKILFQKFWEDLKIENIGKMISEEDYKSYIQQFCSWDEDMLFREAIGINFSKETISKDDTKKKSYSSERQELRLSRNWESPIEIQIVLVNNNNETGWAHHDVYKIRRKIIAKIRRHGWIGIKGLNLIIDGVIAQNTKQNDGKCTIPFSKKQIYEHIIELPDFLIGIRWKSEWIASRKNNTPKNFSTQEVLEKFSGNYPEETASWKIDVFIKNELRMWGFIPLQEISFPPKKKTASQPPLLDQ